MKPLAIGFVIFLAMPGLMVARAARDARPRASASARPAPRTPSPSPAPLVRVAPERPRALPLPVDVVLPNEPEPDVADYDEIADVDPNPVFLAKDGQEITAERIERFLAGYRSPLTPYAKQIVLAGKRYGVDPRLVVAISGTESTFGKFHKGYNAWGWDAPNGLTRWSGWEESIDTYTRIFALAYRSGNPNLIGPRYAPLAPEWPETTLLFFGRI